MIKYILSYTIAFSVGIFIITYLLHLPHIITNKHNIVNEYYRKNYTINIPLDYLFVLIYFIISEFFIYIFNIKSNINKTITVGVVTAILTGLFCLFFTSNKLDKNNFFSKWFHTVGYLSIIYDVILLVFIYSIYMYLNDYVKQ